MQERSVKKSLVHTQSTSNVFLSCCALLTSRTSIKIRSGFMPRGKRYSPWTACLCGFSIRRRLELVIRVGRVGRVLAVPSIRALSVALGLPSVLFEARQTLVATRSLATSLLAPTLFSLRGAYFLLFDLAVARSRIRVGQLGVMDLALRVLGVEGKRVLDRDAGGGRHEPDGCERGGSVSFRGVQCVDQLKQNREKSVVHFSHVREEGGPLDVFQGYGRVIVHQYSDFACFHQVIFIHRLAEHLSIAWVDASLLAFFQRAHPARDNGERPGVAAALVRLQGSAPALAKELEGYLVVSQYVAHLSAGVFELDVVDLALPVAGLHVRAGLNADTAGGVETHLLAVLQAHFRLLAHQVSVGASWRGAGHELACVAPDVRRVTVVVAEDLCCLGRTAGPASDELKGICWVLRGAGVSFASPLGVGEESSKSEC